MRWRLNFAKCALRKMAYRFTMESVVNATMSCLTFFGNVNNFSMDYDGEGPVTARRELAS